MTAVGAAARPTDVARRFGIEPVAVRRLALGVRGNVHWRVSTRSDTFVLRRYRDRLSRETVDYELTVLRHLSSRGWPVPAPLADAVGVGPHWWALFPLLEGRPAKWRDDDPRHARRGELLAELHAETAALVSLGQRDEWHRYDEAGVVTHEHIALLERLRRIDRPRAVAVERHARTIAEGMRFLNLAALPRTVVHGDFVPWNIVMRGGELVSLYDFDLAHLDARAADVAWSAWGGEVPVIVDAYSAIAPLSEEEEAALPLLWRGAWLTLVWKTLARVPDRIDPVLDFLLEKLARPWVVR